MKKFFIICGLAALAFYSHPQAFAMDESDSNMMSQSHSQTISNGAYIGGGVASIFLGFGIGTAIQGRYKWIHTGLQGLAVGGMIATAVVMVDDAVSSNKVSSSTLYI